MQKFLNEYNGDVGKGGVSVSHSLQSDLPRPVSYSTSDGVSWRSLVWESLAGWVRGLPKGYFFFSSFLVSFYSDCLRESVDSMVVSKFVVVSLDSLVKSGYLRVRKNGSYEKK
jgi:hypothetical protein